jgi:hypothetical protein
MIDDEKIAEVKNGKINGLMKMISRHLFCISG